MLKKLYILPILALFAISHCTSDRLLYRNNKNISEDNNFSWNLSNTENEPEEQNNYEISVYDEKHINNNNRKSYTEKEKKVIYSKNKTPEQIKKKSDSVSLNNNEEKANSQNKYYKIRKNDNLLKISKKFNVSINDIIRINKIKNGNKLNEGMVIKIPAQNIYDKSVNKNNQHSFDNKINNFSWPLETIYKTKHDGTDGVKSIGIIITSKECSSVKASADGIVKKVGNMRGFGNYIILKHDNKYLTIYSNLKDIEVNEGESIRKGKKIATLDGNKLHFQIGHSGRPEDPLKYLQKES